MAISTLLLLLASFLFALDAAASLRYKPVYELRPHDDDSIPQGIVFGNPMAGLSPGEMRQRAKAHALNQQLRFDAEKGRRQMAMATRTRPLLIATMDSYMKAYREQHERLQNDVESRQLPQISNKGNSNNIKKLKDPKVKYQQRGIRNNNKGGQRFHHKDSFSLTDYENDAVATSGISQYSLSPAYLSAPLRGGFNPIPDPELPKYNAEHPLASKAKNTRSDVDSLKALIGKNPTDQLKGFQRLLSSSSTQPTPIKKFDFVPAQEEQSSYVDSIHYFIPIVKDHTPITENVQDVADLRQPTPYYQEAQPTKDPIVQQQLQHQHQQSSTSNYYKVEVASTQQVFAEEQPQQTEEIHDYVQQGSEQDHLQYASKYEFGYRVSDPHSGNEFGHEEVSDGDTAKGAYHVLLPDGRLQRVNYVAGPSGYHARVSYQ